MEQNDRMEQNDMMEKIVQSAQDLEVPDALTPDRIKRQISDGRRKKRRFYKTAAAAACLLLCFGAGSYVLSGASHFYDNSYGSSYEDSYGSQAGSTGNGNGAQPKAVGKDSRADDADHADGSAAGADYADGSMADDADRDGKSGVQMADDADRDGKSGGQMAAAAPLKKIGRMYTLADDYGDVYDVLKKSGAAAASRNNQKQTADFAGGGDGALNSAESKMEAISYGEDDASADFGRKDHSTTNLQTEGVDESDIVKTDGRYIYVVQEEKVKILDVQGKMPKIAGTITPDIDGLESIREMYVADDVLTLIMQAETTSIQERADTDDGEKNKKAGDAGDGSDIAVPQTDALSDMAYRIETSAAVKVVTYDMTNPKKPVQKDTATQDGWYQTSRKIDNRLYLFTNKSLYLAGDSKRSSAIKEDSVGGWLPCVNGRAVSADCIYLPKAGNEGLVVSSFDLADHNKALDTKLLIHYYAQLYVTRSSAYVYYRDYADDMEVTRIARFALDTGGGIRAEAAASLKGGIEDTFAICESGGYLRVLTSATGSRKWENRVYVLDEKMETVGKLTGLAEGETIYSARFTGDIGYFVTYRNTDPLFTVDFSNPKKPKIIGELKVTGFSDYLHFWSDSLLLGIGKETKPDTGESIGIKLSMFDISNPAKVKEKGRIVLEGVSDSEALDDYKSVLVSPEKNIIAFTTETWMYAYRKDFRVFSYADGKFTCSRKRTLASNPDYYYEANRWRSVYVGDMLYLVSAKKTIAFDMKDGWKEIGKIRYVK